MLSKLVFLDLFGKIINMFLSKNTFTFFWGLNKNFMVCYFLNLFRPVQDTLKVSKGAAQQALRMALLHLMI